MNNKKISLVTVVYEGELILLELQARSVARYFSNDFVEEIIILVNDVNEMSVIDRVNKEIKPKYGPLSDKVRVVSSEDIFTTNNRGLFDGLSSFFAKHPELRFRKKKGGWHANNGWAMQQAFKLCAFRAVASDYIVFLDSKNVFLHKQSYNYFVDEYGKPRTQFIPLDALHKRWLPPSCKALGVKYHENFTAQTTQYVTPYTVSTNLLRDVVTAFEKRHDSVQGVFARRFIKPTEFMLINAYCISNFGGLHSVFSNDLVKSDSFYTNTTTEEIDKVFALARTGKVQILGLHVTVMGRLNTSQICELQRLLEAHEIIDQKVNLVELQQRLRIENSGRIKKSSQRLAKKVRQ